MHTILADWEQRFIDYLDTHYNSNDSSHDLHHFKRVWNTAQSLFTEDKMDADLLVILTAAYFHDFISLPKNHPEAALSSKRCAERVGEIGGIPI